MLPSNTANGREQCCHSPEGSRWSKGLRNVTVVQAHKCHYERPGGQLSTQDLPSTLETRPLVSTSRPATVVLGLHLWCSVPLRDSGLYD